MGSCGSKSVFEDAKLEDFELMGVIGKGRYGTVYKAVHRNSKVVLALKEVPQYHMLKTQQNDQKILSKLSDPFIANLHSGFESKESVYLVLDYLSGCNLREYLDKNPEVSEIELQFMAACIVRALDYLNKRGVIHKDLKPENLSFDKKGYLILTDFGLAQTVKNLVPSSSGTLLYMAPEVLFCQNYSNTADIFSLGVILFEIIEKTKPFLAGSRAELMNSYLHNKVKFSSQAYGKDAVDFVDKCLIKNSEKRLGSAGFAEVKKHAWFTGFNWSQLEMFEMPSPCSNFHKRPSQQIKGFIQTLKTQ